MYFVLAGIMFPLVFEGLKFVFDPLQMVIVWFVITGFGFTTDLNVNAFPTQPFIVGVMVYNNSAVFVVELVNAWLNPLWLLNADPPVIELAGDETGTPQVNVVPVG